MSYDLQIWSVLPQGDHGLLPQSDAWQPVGDQSVYAQPRWQIVLGPSVTMDPDDIPVELGTTVEGIQFRTDLILEPIHAPQSAHRLLLRLAKSIAKSLRGVVFDPQAGVCHGKAGVTKISRPPAEEHLTAMVCMKWLFQGGALRSAEGVASLLRILERFVPQFLPRRYGSFEPPQYKFSWERVDHFASQALAEPLVFVWDASPLFSVNFSPNYGPGWRGRTTGRGYCVPYLTLECPAECLSDAGFRHALRQVWERVTILAGPMYGDVRILRNQLRRGNRYFHRVSDPKDPHPVTGPWRGLPQDLGVAVCVGQPYLRLWPDLARYKISADLALASLEDWESDMRIESLIGSPPAELRQPSDPSVRLTTSFDSEGQPYTGGVLTAPSERAARWPLPVDESA